MWLRRKKLEAMLAQAQGSQQEERESRLIEKLLEAMSGAFGVTLDAQAKVIKQHSDFIATMSEVSAKRAAVVLGRRGAAIRGERRRQKLLGTPERQRQQCRVCRGARNLVPADIDFHRQHEGLDGEAIEQAPPSENANGAS